MALDSALVGAAAGTHAVARAAGSGSAMGRIVLVAVVVAAVGAFTVLQLRARSRRRRPPGEPDWTTPPPGHEPGPGDSGRTGDDEALFESCPNWGYWSLPGYRGSPQPPWDAHQPGGALPPR